jgi:hypothetical protein
MSLPVNKKKLDSIVGTTLATNGTQAITATVLQNALYPIINSTFGLKTIWTGQIYLDCGWSRTNHPEDRSAWNIRENYYDPNYFAPDNNSNMADPLNRYIVTNVGSGLLADNGTPNGTFTNAGTTNLQIMSAGGNGLTFNGIITAGILTSISVNNPGTGYYYGWNSDNIQRVRLNVTNSGNPPEIKFNLTNALNVAYNDTQFYSSNWVRNVFNVFIPNKLTAIGGSEGIILAWTDNYGDEKLIENSFSRVDSPVNNVTTGDLRSGQSGFSFSIANQKNYTSSNASITTGARGYLEIKVPIINTTI